MGRFIGSAWCLRLSLQYSVLLAELCVHMLRQPWHPAPIQQNYFTSAEWRGASPATQLTVCIDIPMPLPSCCSPFNALYSCASRMWNGATGAQCGSFGGVAAVCYQDFRGEYRQPYMGQLGETKASHSVLNQSRLITPQSRRPSLAGTMYRLPIKMILFQFL